jgi:hypothetical protein
MGGLLTATSPPLERAPMEMGYADGMNDVYVG